MLATAGGLAGQARAASTPVVTPLSAAGFRNSIGVNTHVGYTDTSYGNWSGVLAALQQLGVTHVRDLLIDNGVSSYMQQWTSNIQAAASDGIHFDFVMPEPGAALGSVSDLVSMLAGPLRSAVDSVEDPNEYDLADTSLTWGTTLSSYDQSVASAVRSAPALGGVPLIGPSLVNGGSYQTLGNQSQYLDEGNIHPYQAGMPQLSFIQQALANEASVAGSKPTVVTEFGDSNALNSPAGGYPPVSQHAAADYILRTYLLDYMAGIPRSYAYELVNEQADAGLTNIENNFGLMNSDLTPKPAYTALRNLLQTIGTPAAPASLVPIQLGISSPASTLKYLLLQTDATHYQLVLWNDVSVWNSDTRQDVPVSPVTATISAPQVAGASLVRPLVSNSASAVTVRSGSMSVPVQADPEVISLTLSGSGSGSGSGGSGSGKGGGGNGGGKGGGTVTGTGGGTSSGTGTSTGSGTGTGSGTSGSGSNPGSGSTTGHGSGSSTSTTSSSSTTGSSSGATRSGSGSTHGVTRASTGAAHGLSWALHHELRIHVTHRPGARVRFVLVRLSAPVRGLVHVQLISEPRRRRVRLASATRRIAPSHAATVRLRIDRHSYAGGSRLVMRVTLTCGGRSALIVRHLTIRF